MNENDLEHFKELLLKRGGEIKHALETMAENNTAVQEKFYPTELSNYDNHPAEIASELFQAEINNALEVHEEDLLREIRDALNRINEGKYGLCELCGKKISKERLEAIPYARLCIRCEENKHRGAGDIPQTRPNEELVLDVPIGRKYLNSREDEEHEGIDCLNDLMKYGSVDTPQDLGGYHDYKEFYTNEDDRQGVVEDTDMISNDDYKKQLPD